MAVESLFGANPTIGSPDLAENTYTMATRVTFAKRGKIRWIRFWSASNALSTSPSAAIFATSGGDPLATKAFTGLTTGQWNTATLDTPYQIEAGGTTLDIAVGPINRYAATTNVFASPLVVGNLTGTAGRFIANPTLAFPTSSSTTWYSVDVGFEEDPVAATGNDLSATYYANELANTIVAGVPTLTMAAALVKWANENPDISVVDALNKEAGNSLPNYRAIVGVLNQLAATTDLSAQGALEDLAHP